MADGRFDRPDDENSFQAAATYDGYAVFQLPGGEAAFIDSPTPVQSGAYVRPENTKTRGKVRVTKTAGVVLLYGQEVWWDHSAQAATYRRVNDRDFLLGTMAEDATSAQTSAIVDFNKRCRALIDVKRDPCLSTTAGTVAAGGFDRARRIGGTHKLLLSSTNEAQKVDLLSRDGFAPGANAIVEAVFTVVSDGAGTAPDFNIGLANDTHATDADSITESLFLHLDGNNTNINLESDDGTTEVAATDTTLDYTEGSTVATRVHVLFDTRDLEDIQIYVNGALVLGSTVFKLNAATGPLRLLAHLEKTAAADTYEIDVDEFRCWTAEQ